MIKKLNKYLLENHPLIWNTRLIWMLGIMTVMHIVFFLIGYFSYFRPVDLHKSNLFNNYLDSGFVWIGILLSILILILWMNQYFKQNAFKSHYPKSNFSLYKEFLIILFISILGITQYLSYTKGLQIRVANLKTTQELKKEIDLVNRVAAFTLQNDYSGTFGVSYNHANRCLDVATFDSLVSRDELLKLYVQNRIKQNVWNNVKIEDYKNFNDSLKNPLYRYIEYEILLRRAFPERENINQFYSGISVDSYNYTHKNVHGIEEYAPMDSSYFNGPNLRSIYNYCGIAVSTSDSSKNGEFYAKETYKLLNGNEKDVIQKLLKDYLKLADEYEVGYRFKDKQWIDYVFNPPYYFVDPELSTPSKYNEVNRKHLRKDYVAQVDLESSLELIKKAKSGVFESYVYLVFLYIGLSIALLIYTFRTSTMRTWVISIVGSIVIFFIYFCLYFLFGMIVFNINETSAFILLLLFIATFFTLALSGILTRKRKMVSGVNLNWSIWTFGAIIPICVGLYDSYLSWKFPYKYQYEVAPIGYKYKIHPHQEWINNNWETIFYLNLILVLIFIWLIIPIIKKWKAMPEE